MGTPAVVLICLFIFGLPCRSHATVVLYDKLTTVGTPVTLTIRTKGLIGPQSGQTFSVLSGKKTLCKGLTGFDGYGYCEITPSKKGALVLTVRTKGESTMGTVYVLSRTRKLFLLQMESLGLFSPFLIIDKSRLIEVIKTLNEISPKYFLVYISSELGFLQAKKMFLQAGLPEGPVLEYSEGLFEDLKQQKLYLYGLLCSGQVCTEASGFFKKIFSFQELEDVVVLEHWTDLLKHLGLRSRQPSGSL